MDRGGIGLGGMDWVCLVRNRDKWRALVNAFVFHKMLGSP